jgi:hypothetical protein
MKKHRHEKCPNCKVLEREIDSLRDQLELKTQVAVYILDQLLASQEKLISRNSPARNFKRDAEIARLRDENNKKWIVIGKHFEISADAAKKAYRRYKKWEKNAIKLIEESKRLTLPIP